MNEPRNDPEPAGELPRAVVKRQTWSFPAVWVVPVAAALVAAYLVYERVRDLGPEITIRFEDAGGVRAGQTPLRYRDVPVGEVTAIELSEDGKHAVVRARLRRPAVSVAREGTVFWIVRPEVGIRSITGLGTVITGPQIEVLPGTGKPKREFVGLAGPPVQTENEGRKIVLLSGHLGSLKIGSPVFYRGIEVGAVYDTRLGPDATTVNIGVFVGKRYAPLVREGSKFWNVSGMDVSVGLFRGVDIRMESLGTLVAGGVAFSTPEDTDGRPAKDGAVFRLHDEPKKEWLEWDPKISIPLK
jgi:paraquat-inducible protein B